MVSAAVLLPKFSKKKSEKWYNLLRLLIFLYEYLHVLNMFQQKICSGLRGYMWEVGFLPMALVLAI
jgi:hypothetical protein